MAYRKIPDQIIETIRERVAIDQVVGDYVPLRRAGRHFKGLCPFHQEKTPSFTVNTDLQIFKCFGCGESGNVFSFLMKYENITFVEAVEKLALSSGVTLPEEELEAFSKPNDKNQIHDILNHAWVLYRKTLLEASVAGAAREYLSKRGMTRAHCVKYGLGYAPDQWDYLSKTLNGSAHNLLLSGLVLKHNESGRIYDRFRNRIIFPIRHYRTGNVIGFGGRTLGNDPAKYINSPESPVYHKSSVLYGLYESGKSIRDTGSAILVEGYFDRISMDIAGISNTVAPCGTALSNDQIRLLKRYANSVTILFDSDTAGVKAAQKGLELCLAAGLECCAVPLPHGFDPDDVIASKGPDEIKKHLSKALPGIDFLIRTASSRHNLKQSRGRKNVVEELVPFLIDVNNSIDRGVYASRIADMISVPATSVLELCRRRLFSLQNKTFHRQSEADRHSRQDTIPAEPVCFRERQLFSFLVNNPDYLTWKDNPLTLDSMITESGRIVYQALKEDAFKNGKLALDRILGIQEDPKIQHIMIDLFENPGLSEGLIKADPHMTFQSIISEFRQADLRKEMEYIKKQLKNPAMTPEKLDMLLKRKIELLNDMSNNSSIDEYDEQ